MGQGLRARSPIGAEKPATSTARSSTSAARWLPAARTDSGHDWSISIADPRRRDRPVLALRLSNRRSLDLGRFGEGPRRRRAPHRALLDPRNGEPAAGFRIGHGHRSLGARRGHPVDRVLRPRPGEGPRAFGRLRQRGCPERSAVPRRPRGDGLEARYEPRSIARLVISADTTGGGRPFDGADLDFRRSLPCIAYLESRDRLILALAGALAARAEPRRRPRRRRPRRSGCCAVEKLLAETRCELAQVKAASTSAGTDARLDEHRAQGRHPRPGDPKHEDRRGGRRECVGERSGRDRGRASPAPAAPMPRDEKQSLDGSGRTAASRVYGIKRASRSAATARCCTRTSPATDQSGDALGRRGRSRSCGRSSTSATSSTSTSS